MPQAELLTMLETALSGHPPAPLAVAVSGGSDSLALLHLAHLWAQRHASSVQAVTVDHGLRPEAASEARYVGEIAAGLGIEHSVVHWRGWNGQGNLQDQARRARYALMADWAKSQDIGSVLVGHTADDQAETFLMRLARGAGVDGLSAMDQHFGMAGTQFVRPLLHARRQDLRLFLENLGVQWVDDPSNHDPRYERVKVRDQLPVLAGIGIDTATLSQVADHMSEAHQAVVWAARQFALSHMVQQHGDLHIDAAALAALPDAVVRHLLGAALQWIASADYGARGKDLGRFMSAARTQQGATLHGCQMVHRKGEIALFREFAAVQSTQCSIADIWDGRWSFDVVEAPEGAYVAALGQAGLAQCPTWRESGRRAAAVMADPAIWHAGAVISAPTAGFEAKNHAILRPVGEEFINSL